MQLSRVISYSHEKLRRSGHFFSESEKRKFDTDDFTRGDLDSSKFYLHLDLKSIRYAYQKLHAEQVAENR